MTLSDSKNENIQSTEKIWIIDNFSFAQAFSPVLGI